MFSWHSEALHGCFISKRGDPIQFDLLFDSCSSRALFTTSVIFDYLECGCRY